MTAPANDGAKGIRIANGTEVGRPLVFDFFYWVIWLTIEIIDMCISGKSLKVYMKHQIW